jgi:hypothetical protein
MLTKIGFLLSDCGPNQAAYEIIKSCNEYLSRKDNIDPIIFWRNISPFVITPNFSSMCMYEAYRYNGNLISFDLNSATRSLDYFVDSRYFYVFDLEWCHIKNRPYEQLAEIYQNPKLKLIARSQQHYDIIKLSWGILPVGIVQNSNIEEFAGIINGENNGK